MKNNNIDIQLCDIKTFEKCILDSNENYFGIIGYLSNVSGNNSNGVIVDNSYTNSILKKLNLAWPKITEDYLQSVINYLIKYKFIGDKK